MKQIDEFIDKVAQIMIKAIIIIVLILIAYHLRKATDLHRAKYIMQENGNHKENLIPFSPKRE